MKKLFIFAFLVNSLTSLQAVVIRGSVTDQNNGEALIGATIFIKELNTGTVTGLDGTYRISISQEGSYTAVVSYIGYTLSEKKFEVTSSSAEIILDVTLKSSDISMSEVNVTAYSDRGTEKSARLSEKNSSGIINVVSAGTIELSPDLTIANVIQRMSGVTLEKGNSGDGQYATLRGMDKRYNYTLVNSVKIPSTNSRYRYLPLNLFPSDMVERLEITKTLTSDMEGDAIGGVVNMIMKDAPARLQVRANLALGYAHIFLKNDFSSFNSSELNKQSPYEIYGSKYAATESDFPKSNLQPESIGPAPDISMGLSVGNRFLNKKVGLIVSASLLNTYRGSESLLFDVSNTNDERNLPLLNEKQKRKYSNHEVLAGFHNKIDYQIDKNNSLKLYLAYIIQNNDQVRETEALLFNSYTPGIGTYTQEYDTRLRHRSQSLLNATLQGEHKIFKLLQFKWSGVWSVASQSTPDNSNIALVSDFEDYIEQEISVVEKASTRRWERNQDNDISGYFDLGYASTDQTNRISINTGGMFRFKERTSFYNRYRLIPVSDRPPPFQNFSQKGIDWNTFDEINWQVLNPPDPTHALNYNASEDVIAGYVRSDISRGTLQLTGGLRLQSVKQGYILHYEQYGSEPVGETRFTDLLPSVLARYTIKNNQNIRASYFRGINLPGFLEIVPYIDKEEDYDEGGNSSLRRAIADNIDLRYEFYPKPLDQFMAGIFFKNIKDPIEYGFEEYASTRSIIYIPGNYGTARNYGIEIDYIKHLRNFAIRSNYTYTRSGIKSEKILPVRDNDGNLVRSFVEQTRPLAGQSEHTANLSLIFKSIRHKWDSQIAATYNSEKIAVVSQYLDNDTWESGGIRLDFSFEKTLFKTFSLFLKANNLLNTPREQYIKLQNPDFADYPDQDYKPGKTLVRRDFEMQSYLIGMRYIFN